MRAHLKIPRLFLALAVGAVWPGLAQAATTQNAPASTFSFDPRKLDDCYVPDGGKYVSATDSTATCTGESALLFPAGTAISDITVYFYDNSTACDVTVSLVRRSLNAGSTAVIATFTSSATSTTVQNTTLGAVTLGASYWYAITTTTSWDTGNACRVYGYKVSY